MKKTQIILIIFLIIALIGGLALVRQSQDARKGASFGKTKLIVLPSEKIIKDVGDEVSVKVYFQTESEAKVDGVQTVLCFGPELSLVKDNVVASSTSGFGSDPVVVFKDVSGKKCVTMVATSQKEASDLKTAGEAFALKFRAEKAGSGALTLDKALSTVTGDNTKSATDKEIAVTGVENTTYQIGGAGTCETLWWTDDTHNTCTQKEFCGNYMYAGLYTYDTEAKCKAGLQTCNLTVVPPRPCPSGMVCMTSGSADGGDGRCAFVETGVPVLNYKVSFGDVKSGDTNCAVNWPLQVIVLSSGVTKVFNNVIPELTTEKSGDLAVYKGSLNLAGFNKFSKVAVFIKGPKHLQMKYAEQNQDKSYDQAGGELVLTDKKSTSIVYDFSKYPMLAGDVVGSSADDRPNGEINGVDFSFVKGLPKNILKTEGTIVEGDLDGNCIINSNDINVLKRSLETKQGQLY